MLTVSTDVARPADEVFAYATDPARFPEWQQGVLGGDSTGSGTPGVGERCTTTRRIGFAVRAVKSEVTHADPPRRWGIRGVDGPIRAVVDVIVEARGEDRSRLTIGIAFTGVGVGRLLVPLVVRRQARREMPRNIAALKARLEAPGAATAP